MTNPEQAELRDLLLEHLPARAMILKKETREIVYANRLARESGAQFGQTCFTTCAQRDTPCPFCRAPEVWADNRPARLEVEYQGRHYQGIWLPLDGDFYVHYIFDLTESKRAEADLRRKTALLEAQVDSTIDGILIVDQNNNKVLQNKRCIELWKLPPEIVANDDDKQQVEFVKNRAKDPEAFVAKVAHLYSHPEEVSRDEVEFKDGTILDRYSAPVIGEDGTCFGRIWTFRDITEARAIRTRMESLARFPEENPSPILRADRRGRIIYANPAAAALLDGWGTSVGESLPVHLGGLAARTVAENQPRAVEQHVGDRVYSLSLAPVPEADYVNIYAHDDTGRRRLEEQLRQVQKMEAIGRLAGGVAHDFNNILTTIIGNCEFVRAALPPDSPLAADVDTIRQAGERAAALTNQLLAFSRRQILKPQVLNLNKVVEEMRKMLARLIGEHIRISTDLAADLGRVRADPGQVAQILVNLAVNARDAMPDGGRLTIVTANVDLEARDLRRLPDLLPGPHVRLAVSDTGQGMDPQTLQHAFEPFFTTKGPGEGTGLGLATVYGIVKQSNGQILAASDPERGTTLEIYLPRVEAPTEPLPRLAPDTGTGGAETILLVEDDPQVRALAGRVLKGKGYRVLAAAEAESALKLAAGDKKVDLLVSDVIMPGLNGSELYARLRRLFPDLPVLFLSGYADEAVVQAELLEHGRPLLAKPFTAAALAQQVRRLLDSRGPGRK